MPSLLPMFTSVIWLDLALATLALFLVKSFLSKRPPLPPGPKGLPLLGNLFDMPKSREWLTFAKWGQQYGACLKARRNTILILFSNQATYALSWSWARRSSFSTQHRQPSTCSTRKARSTLIAPSYKWAANSVAGKKLSLSCRTANGSATIARNFIASSGARTPSNATCPSRSSRLIAFCARFWTIRVHWLSTSDS
jgi:hypothetical protein